MAPIEPADGPKVLYIAGLGRSGSTLLDNVLGQLDGVCAVGQLRSLWETLWLRPQRLCSCGQLLRECRFWRSVQERAFDGKVPNSESVTRTQWATLGMRPRKLLRLRRAIAGARPDVRLEGYLEGIASMYRAVARESAADVIVDSSKSPTDAYALGSRADVDLHVLHLVRDPRACADSWSRARVREDSDDAEQTTVRNPVDSAARWTVTNAILDRAVRPALCDRYMLMRYEDFAFLPLQAIRTVCRFISMDDRELPFHGERRVSLAPTHGPSGNPSRIGRSSVEIRPDERWRSSMSRRGALLVSLAALPLMHRYGYDLWDHRGP